ncbi:MAG TPA: hypothetical protein VGW78_04065 [Candidatus Babeliales bacterium]|jgi:hypothetical protein|nr:hypothetical protein [Candidatus Babeliales bacterium]
MKNLYGMLLLAIACVNSMQGMDQKNDHTYTFLGDKVGWTAEAHNITLPDTALDPRDPFSANRMKDCGEICQKTRALYQQFLDDSDGKLVIDFGKWKYTQKNPSVVEFEGDKQQDMADRRGIMLLDEERSNKDPFSCMRSYKYKNGCSETLLKFVNEFYAKKHRIAKIKYSYWTCIITSKDFPAEVWFGHDHMKKNYPDITKKALQIAQEREQQNQ